MGAAVLGELAGDDVAVARDDGPSGLYRWTAVAVALVPALTHLARLLTTESQWQFALYEDDAFYYLGVARSVAEGHGSTFTGLLDTNGYHPLWMLVLVPLATVFRDPNNLLIGVAVVQGGLWALSVREALRIGRIVGCWQCAAGSVAIYGVLTVLTGHLAFNGMESALVLPLMLMLVRLGLEARDQPGADLRLGVLLALVCLARLDAVLAAVPLGLVLLFRDAVPRRPRARRALHLALPTAVALGAYVAVNMAMFGSATPVSGRAKGLGAPFLNTEPLTQFLRAGDVSGRSLWFGTAALAFVVAAWWTRTWRGDPRVSRLMACTLALVVGEAFLLAYLVFGTSYRVWPWYHYLVALFAFLAAVVVARWAVDRFGAVVPRLCLGVAAAFLVLQAGIVFRPEDPAYTASVTGARYVADNLPDDAVLAMGDRAGIFGFLAERPLLQLEGLMADSAFLDDLAAGRAGSRMVSDGVDYYVHYGMGGERIIVAGRSCEQFTEPHQGEGPNQAVVVCDEDRVFVDGDEGDSLRIWRFRPELNSV